MAERERLTNKERRAQAREERRRKEAEEAAKRKRGQIKSGLVTFVIVAVVAVVLLQAFLGGAPSIDEAITVSAEEVEDLRESAGCEVLVERSPLPDRDHYEATQVPSADALYGDVRPTHSGSHTVSTHPITASASNQISEVATTHNLEHGTIIAWWDPEQVDGSTASAIGDWAEKLNANGFRRDPGGAGILSAPYEDPEISSGKALALRAWGTAMDCDEWDETVANAFVIDNFGVRGIAPERSIGGYPQDVLDYSDREVEETSDDEAPTDEEEPSEELTEEELSELEGSDDDATNDEATDEGASDDDAADGSAD